MLESFIRPINHHGAEMKEEKINSGNVEKAQTRASLNKKWSHRSGQECWAGRVSFPIFLGTPLRICSPHLLNSQRFIGAAFAGGASACDH